MVVRVGHIHISLHPFVILPAMELVSLVLCYGIGARSDFPNIFEFPCRRTGRVARFRGSSLGRASGKVTGDILVLGTFLFKVCG